MKRKSKFKDSIILIKPKKVNFISEFLCDLEDIIYASKIQLNIQPNQPDYTNQDSYVILTYGFIYIFIKDQKNLKMFKQISLFDCHEIKLNNPDDSAKVNITIKTNQDQCQKLIELSKGKKINAKIPELYYKICNVMSIISSNFTSSFAKPNLYPPAPINPLLLPEVLYRRSLYLIYCDIKQNKINKSSLEGAKYLNDQNNFQENCLFIRSTFHPGDFIPYFGKAISSLTQINKIIFQNFNDSKINDLIESIITPSNTTQVICFSEYQTPSLFFNLATITFPIEAIEFSQSTFSFINSFLKNCVNYSCDIKSVSISNLSIQSSDLTIIFDEICQMKCFNNLKSFSLSNMACNSFPFESFENFLNSHGKLESLTISKIPIDGSKLLGIICKCEPDIYKLHMNYLDFQTPLNSGEDNDLIDLPYNLTLIDFSHSKFFNKNNSLKPVLELITKSSARNTFYMVDMSYLEPASNTFMQVFKEIDLSKVRPNIGELNYSGNMLCTGFFDFVSTQKKLQIIALNNCRVKNQDKMYSTILGLLKELKHLIGIEFGFEDTNPSLILPFLSSCKQFHQLEHFYFSCQEGQDEIANNISDLIYSLPNIKEVSFNMPKLSKDAYKKLIGFIYNNKSILAWNCLHYEGEKSEDVEQLYSALLSKNLKKSTTMDERANILILQKKENNQNDSIDITTTIKMKISQPEMVYKVDEIEEEEEGE